MRKSEDCDPSKPDGISRPLLLHCPCRLVPGISTRSSEGHALLPIERHSDFPSQLKYYSINLGMPRSSDQGAIQCLTSPEILEIHLSNISNINDIARERSSDILPLPSSCLPAIAPSVSSRRVITRQHAHKLYRDQQISITEKQ